MDDPAPYRPPETYTRALLAPGFRPPVWPWYIAYCSILALLYVLCAAAGVALLIFGPDIAEEANEDAVFIQIQGGVLLAISIPLTALFGAAPFLPKKKWAWIYGFFPICIGFTSCCILPFSIALLIFWLKSETKAFFNVE